MCTGEKKGVPSSLWRATMLSKLCAAGGAWTDLTLTRRQSRILQSSLAGDKKITRDGKRGPKAAWASSAEKDVSSRSAFSSSSAVSILRGVDVAAWEREAPRSTAVVKLDTRMHLGFCVHFGSGAACRGAAVVGARGNAPPTLLRTSTVVPRRRRRRRLVTFSCHAFFAPALD